MLTSEELSRDSKTYAKANKTGKTREALIGWKTAVVFGTRVFIYAKIFRQKIIVSRAALLTASQTKKELN